MGGVFPEQLSTWERRLTILPICAEGALLGILPDSLHRYCPVKASESETGEW